jgi:hypothetical protein
VGPFAAGAQQSPVYPYGAYYYYGGIVWWSNLNTANTCSQTSPLYQNWAVPNNLCNADGQFVIPPESVGIQACMVLATIFSFMACCTGFSVSRGKTPAGASAACASFLAMVFSIAGFAIWTTWSMSLRLQRPAGDYVPVWSAISSTSSEFNLRLTPQPVRVFYGWTFVSLPYH